MKMNKLWHCLKQPIDYGFHKIATIILPSGLLLTERSFLQMENSVLFKFASQNEKKKTTSAIFFPEITFSTLTLSF